MNRVLTRAQLEQYKEEGYVIVQDVVEQATLLRMKEVLANLVEKSRNVTSHDDVFDLEPGHSATSPKVRRIKKPHVVNHVFNDFMKTPKFVAILQDLALN